MARSLPDSTQDIRHLSSSQGVAALLQALMIYGGYGDLCVTYVWSVLVLNWVVSSGHYKK